MGKHIEVRLYFADADRMTVHSCDVSAPSVEADVNAKGRSKVAVQLSSAEDSARKLYRWLHSIYGGEE